ncbi:heat shock protein beta-7 [Diretmus argenteus]
MASLTSSSCRSSSSSYHSSARYSSSSSYRSEGSIGGSADSLDPLFEPFLDPADRHSLFGEEGPGGSLCVAPFTRHSRSPYGHTGPTGGAVTDHQASMGAVRLLGDSYYMSADISRFEPHDVVVMAYNHHVVIHAEKVLDDGSISNTFTHKSLFPEDMDPLSVSGTLNPDGILVVSVRRTPKLEPLGAPSYPTEAHFDL